MSNLCKALFCAAIALSVSSACAFADTVSLGNVFISQGKYKAQWFRSTENNVPNIGYVVADSLIEADCNKGVYRQIGGTAYDKTGKVIETVKFFQPWTVAKPNTRAYNWYANICSH